MAEKSIVDPCRALKNRVLGDANYRSKELPGERQGVARRGGAFIGSTKIPLHGEGRWSYKAMTPILETGDDAQIIVC